MSTYLWIDLGTFALPFAFSFHPRIRFHRQWRTVWPAILLTGAFFIPWDALFAAQGIWAFNPEHLVGAYLIGLPVEEWLFFICVPFACLFTYHCITLLVVTDPIGRAARPVAWTMLIASLSIALLNLDLAYTATTFAMVAVWLAFLLLVARPVWLGRFLITYAVLFLPFLLVNGLLTGMGQDAPVVRYNEAEMLGIRIGTIPLEDVFYGMLLILMNVTFHEALKARRGPMA